MPAEPTRCVVLAAATALAVAAVAVAGDEPRIADDVVLSELLEKAIDLRRREDFDRMLDARDPGELIEHATLTDFDFDRRKLGIDTLFIVGDELFAYPFRPENGWGGSDRRQQASRSNPSPNPSQSEPSTKANEPSTKASESEPLRRKKIDYTPSPRRVHDGASGGPDAFACASCHSKGGPDGAGTQTQNAFLRGDGRSIRSADQRNPPHVLGLGPVELLAREMTGDLAAAVAAATESAKKDSRRVEAPLVSKGVSFGSIAVSALGELDTSGVEGVDSDLVVRPFGWKGHQASLRAMVEESLQLHLGLVSRRVQLGVKDGSVDRTPYGDGPWDDVDQDGVSLEIDSGMLTTVVGYLAQLEVPVVRPPRDPGLLDRFAEGRVKFDAIGCATCHVPALQLRDPQLDAAAGTGRPPFVLNVATDGDGPKVEPVHAGPGSPYRVHLFSDLKRHDMGDALASQSPEASIPARHFLTRPLWGLAESAPYLHDGRAPSIHDAIVLHDGAARAARDGYLALAESERANVRVFLASLSRQPKLFVP